MLVFATYWWIPLHQVLSVPSLEKVVPSCQKVYGPLHLGRKSLAGLSRMQHGKPVSGVMPQSPPRELAPETLGVGVHVLECYPHCVAGGVGVVSVFLLLLMSSSSLLVISQTDPQTCDEGFNCHGDVCMYVCMHVCM